MGFLRATLMVLLMVSVSACAKSVWDSDEKVTKASYSQPSGPRTLTLVTVINNDRGEGGHSALVVNAHERVVFDPAGNFKHEKAPERNDVVFGMTPGMLNAYYRFHARTEWHVVMQTIEVSPEVAAIAYRKISEYGAVPSAYCANSVSAILGEIPGFESIRTTFYPKKLMQEFAGIPNVETDKFYEYD